MDTNAKNGLENVGSQGPVVGIIIVIIVLVVGGFYFFNELQRPAQNENAVTMPPTSSSTETTDIENDLNAEDFNSIDAEMGDLEAEFQE